MEAVRPAGPGVFGSEGRQRRPLYLSLHMLQVVAYRFARAAADDRPPEQSLEAGHPVAARPRDRDERGAAAAGSAALVDEKAQLERRVEVVARVELLDRNGVRDGRRRTGSQRIDRDV